MNPSLSVLLHQAKGKVLTAINESGLTPELADLVLSSVLSDVRSQENLELLNYSKALEEQLQNVQENVQEEKIEKAVKIDG
jgi:hypothetical protein